MMAFSKTVLRVVWWLVRILAIVLVWTPWLVVRAFGVGVGVTRSFVAVPRGLFAAARDEVACPRCGRRQSLLARWRCPICKSVETTHAWASCSVCGTQTPAGYVACEDPSCGEAIGNPRLRGVS